MSRIEEWARSPQGIATLVIGSITVTAALYTLTGQWQWTVAVLAGLVGVILLAVLAAEIYHRVVLVPRRRIASLKQSIGKWKAHDERQEARIASLTADLDRQEARVGLIYERLLSLAEDESKARMCSLVARLDALGATFRIVQVAGAVVTLRSEGIDPEELAGPGFRGFRMEIQSRDRAQRAIGEVVWSAGETVDVQLAAEVGWVEPDLLAVPAGPLDPAPPDQKVGHILFVLEHGVGEAAAKQVLAPEA